MLTQVIACLKLWACRYTNHDTVCYLYYLHLLVSNVLVGVPA
jgi:hypothetical protein